MNVLRERICATIVVGFAVGCSASLAQHDNSAVGILALSSSNVPHHETGVLYGAEPIPHRREAMIDAIAHESYAMIVPGALLSLAGASTVFDSQRPRIERESGRPLLGIGLTMLLVGVAVNLLQPNGAAESSDGPASKGLSPSYIPHHTQNHKPSRSQRSHQSAE